MIATSTDDLHHSKYAGLKRLFILLFLGLAFFLGNFQRFSMGIASIYIAEDFSLNSAQLGLLGSVFLYSYSVFQIPAGLLADKFGTRPILVLSCLITGTTTLWFAFADTFIELLLARTLIGAAVAFIYIPSLSAIRSIYGDASLGFAFGVFVAVGQLGAVFSGAPLKYFIAVLSWKGVYIASGLIFLLLVILAFALLEKKNRGESIAQNKVDYIENKEKESIFNKNLFHPMMIVIILWFFIVGGARFCFQSLWASHYIIDVIGWSEERASMMLTVIAVGSCFGAITLGKVADRIGSLRTIVISSFIFSTLWFFIIFINFNIPNVYHYLLYFFFGFLASGMFSAAFSCVKLFAQKGNAGVINGAINCSQFIGAAVFIQISGIVIEYLVNVPLNERYYILLSFFGISSVLLSFVLMYKIKRSFKSLEDRNIPQNDEEIEIFV